MARRARTHDRGRLSAAARAFCFIPADMMRATWRASWEGARSSRARFSTACQTAAVASSAVRMLAGMALCPAATGGAVAPFAGDQPVAAVVGRGDEDGLQDAVLGDGLGEGVVDRRLAVVGVGVDEVEGDRLGPLGGRVGGHGVCPFGVTGVRPRRRRVARPTPEVWCRGRTGSGLTGFGGDGAAVGGERPAGGLCGTVAATVTGWPARRAAATLGDGGDEAERLSVAGDGHGDVHGGQATARSAGVVL